MLVHQADATGRTFAFDRYRNKLDAWVAAGVSDKPQLYEDFMAGTYYAADKAITADFPAFLAATGGAFTRASGGTAHDGAGKLIEFAAGEPRITDTGLRLEGAVTNLIRNPRCEGAVVGSPGTLQTYASWSSSSPDVFLSVVGKGSENGTPYIDVRLAGVAAAASDGRFYFESSPGQATGGNVTLTISTAMKIVAGSLSGFNTVRLRNVNYAGGSFVGSNDGPDLRGVLSGVLTRYSYSAATTSGAQTTNPAVELKWNAGATIDLTLRIAVPQLTATPSMSSVILPPAGSPAQATRAADVLVGSRVHVPAFSKLIRARTATNGGSSTQVLWYTDDNSSSNRLYVMRNWDGTLHIRVFAGGADTLDLAVGSVGDNTDFAIALRVAANDVAASLNGGALVTNTSAALPSSLTYDRLGLSHSQGSPWNGSIRGNHEFPTLLSNTKLQTLSALI